MEIRITDLHHITHTVTTFYVIINHVGTHSVECYNDFGLPVIYKGKI